MRVLGFALALLTLAIAPAHGDERLVIADARPRFVDAAPRGPGAYERLAEIRRRIQESVEYPPMARHQRIEGEALVRFEIDPDGTPREIRVHGSSGAPVLDRAAARAVQRSAPLPWVYGRLEVPVRFELDARR